MTSLLYKYTPTQIGILNTFVKRTKMPSLPEIVTDQPMAFPKDGEMTVTTKQESWCTYITLRDRESHLTSYAIFNISRSSDMVKNFKVIGELAQNTSAIMLVIGRQIVLDSTDISNSIGNSWFPIPALSYNFFSIWCKLINENGPKTGAIEYTSCLLPDKGRAELVKIPYIFPIGYNVLLHKGSSINDRNIGDRSGEKFINLLKHTYSFYDKDSLHTHPLIDKIILLGNQGTFRNFGHVFHKLYVEANKSGQFLLKANDLVIHDRKIEANSSTDILPDIFFVYPMFNEIAFEFIPDDSRTEDLICSVERSELLLKEPISDDKPYLIPELNLVLFKGVYCASKCYAETLVNSSTSFSTQIENIN
jgi:hypothetical protein